MSRDQQVRHVMFDKSFICGTGGVTSIDLPPLGAIGFIPYERRFHPPPGNIFNTKSAYHEHPLETSGLIRHAFCKLFATGNETEWHAEASFVPWQDPNWIEKLDDGDMRAAIALDDLRVFRDSRGVVVGLQGRYRMRVGDTPAGPRALFRYGPKTPRTMHAGKGHAGGDRKGDDPMFESIGVSAILEHGVGFKIGTLGEIIGRVFTRRWAPTTFIVLRLEFPGVAEQPLCTAYVRAPAIPSVYAWFGPNRVCELMRSNATDDIDLFLHTVDEWRGEWTLATPRPDVRIGTYG